MVRLTLATRGHLRTLVEDTRAGGFYLARAYLAIVFKLGNLVVKVRNVVRVLVRVAIDLLVHWKSHWQPPRNSVCMRKCIC